MKTNNWRLPSMSIVTDRVDNETDLELLFKHEAKRRIQAESDLIKALDLIQELRDIQAEKVDEFLNNFK